MRRVILLLLWLVFAAPLFSQKVERIIIKGGPGFYESLRREVYLYPTFSNGTIYFKNGEVFPAKLNYHKGLEQIQLILDADTVALGNLYEIKHVTINSDTLLYSGRFIMLVHRTGGLVLGKQGKVKPAKKEEKLAYRRIPHPVSSADPYNTLGLFRGYGSEEGKKDFPLIKQTTFYIGNRHHQFTKVTRKNILYMFPGREHLVSNYLTQHSIKLDQEADLKQLLGYLQTLR